MALTPKQQRFVAEYLADLNATQAAIRAGYSARTANEQGARLLAKVSIALALQEAMTARQLRSDRTADDVLRDIEAVKRDAMQLVKGKGMIDRGAALKALELEGRHRAMFTDKTEHSGPGGAPFSIAVVFE